MNVLSGTPSSLGNSVPYIASGLSAIAVAGYLGMVVYQGNVAALGSALYADSGYLEFVLGLFVIYQLMSFAPTSDLTTGLFILALLGVLLKFAAAVDFQTVKDFTTGKISLYDLMVKLSAAVKSVGISNLPSSQITTL